MDLHRLRVCEFKVGREFPAAEARACEALSGASATSKHAVVFAGIVITIRLVLAGRPAAWLIGQRCQLQTRLDDIFHAAKGEGASLRPLVFGANRFWIARGNPAFDFIAPER